MNIQNQYVLNLAEKDLRIDKRGPYNYRKISIEINPIENAEGSARVKIGGTEILVGIKMSIGEPFPDKPGEGILIVGAEFSPIASPSFEPGRPQENSIELARVVDRGVRESKSIQLEKMCIKKGETVWAINVDIHIINHEGNLLDASALATIVALLNTKIPAYDGENIDYSQKTKKLPVVCKPIAVTFAKIGDKFFADPNLDEENTMKGSLTIVTKDNGNICAIQKIGPVDLEISEITKLIEESVKKCEELRKILEGAN